MTILSVIRSRLLLVEDDQDTRELLAVFLTEEGYEVVLAASLEEGMALVEQQTFQLILADLFADRASEPLKSIESLRRLAQPMPVGVITSWPVSAGQAEREGFACLVLKPFDLDELLTTIAASLKMPLSPAQQRQARVVERYFAIQASGNLEALAEVCTETIHYYTPTASPYATAKKISGLAPYRAYIEGAYAYYSNLHVEDLALYGRPKGIAARYLLCWSMPDGQAQRVAASMLFHFTGERISQVGVRVNFKRISKPPRQGKE